jgi:uncharacterized protein (TIGR00251 family)
LHEAHLSIQGSKLKLTGKEEKLTIIVRVTPNSSVNDISLESDGKLAVKLTSPPVEGKANKDLVKLIAKKLRIPQSDVSIKRGEHSRDKVLVIRGVSTETFRTNLTN